MRIFVLTLITLFFATPAFAADRYEFDKFVHRCVLREKAILDITGANIPFAPITTP